MAKKIKITRKQIKQDDEFITVLKEIFAVIADYSNYIFIGLAVVLAGVLIYFGMDLYYQRVGEKAQTELSRAENFLAAPVVPEKDLKANPNIRKMYPNVMTSDEERLTKAEEKFVEVSKRFAKSKQAVLAGYYEALTLHQMGKCGEAVPAYESFLARTTQADPLWPLAWLGIGYCQEDAGKIDDAAASYAKAAGYEGNAADQMAAYQALARINELKKNYKGAIDDLGNYLRLAGDAPDKATVQRHIDTLKRMAGS